MFGFDNVEDVVGFRFNVDINSSLPPVLGLLAYPRLL